MYVTQKLTQNVKKQHKYNSIIGTLVDSYNNRTHIKCKIIHAALKLLHVKKII